MEDYFTHKPQPEDDVKNISPKSKYHTAPSSRVVTPSESPRSVSKTYNPLDDCCEDDTRSNNKVERDVKKMEQDIEQLMSIGGTIEKDIAIFRRDSRIRDLASSSPSPSPSPSIKIPRPQRSERPRSKLIIEDTPSPPFPSREVIPRPPTPYRPRAPRRSFSTSEADIYSPPSESPPIFPFHSSITPNVQVQPPTPPDGQNQNSDLAALKAALKVIQSQLTLLNNGIKANIAEQLKSIPASPTSGPDGRPIVVLDPGSLPSFKVEGDEKVDKDVSRALLDSVKVCCVVERGLEGIIGILEAKGKGKERKLDNRGEDGKHGKQELDLMVTCMSKSKVVKKEMRSVLKGIEGVVGFVGTQK